SNLSSGDFCISAKWISRAERISLASIGSQFPGSDHLKTMVPTATAQSYFPGLPPLLFTGSCVGAGAAITPLLGAIATISARPKVTQDASQSSSLPRNWNLDEKSPCSQSGVIDHPPQNSSGSE